MKAKTSKRDSEASAPGFGRGAPLILYDAETDSCEIVTDEQGVNGAAVSAEESSSHPGGQVLITGYLGPQACRTLAAAGIEIILDGEDVTVSKDPDARDSGRSKAPAARS